MRALNFQMNEENGKETWEKEEWASEARQLVEKLKNFPDSSKIIVILRHSLRNELTNAHEMVNLGITPLGYEVAKIFGKNIAKQRPIRLFHSIVARCKETALAIKDGFESVSGKVEIKGILDPLFKIAKKSEVLSNILFKLQPKAFIPRWVAGLYPSTLVTPFTDYCQDSARVIWTLLDKAKPCGIDIHVTHDLYLMALRWGWFGIPLSDYWVPYLGGFAFSINQNDITLLSDGKMESFELPYWWNNVK